MALDVIMHRSATFYQENVMLKITKRAFHFDLTVRELQRNGMNMIKQNRNCLRSMRICKHLTAARVPLKSESTRRFHTATSPGTDSHTLFSTRWGRFTSEDDARRQVARLSVEERSYVEKAVEEMKRRNKEKLERDGEPPSWNQLKLRKMM